MTIGQKIFTLLNQATAAENRVYPAIAPSNTDKPYIVYLRVVGLTNNSLAGSTGLENTRMQVDAYAKSYAEAQALAGEVKALMAGWPVQNIPISSQDVPPEVSTKLHRVLMEFSIWHN